MLQNKEKTSINIPNEESCTTYYLNGAFAQLGLHLIFSNYVVFLLLLLLLCGSTVLEGTLAALFTGSVLILFRYLVGVFGRAISPSQRRLPTQDNTIQKDDDKHPCLKPEPKISASKQSRPTLIVRSRGYWDRDLKMN
jgi:hypothetical protein